MALPWLIGAAVVALGAAAVSALKDDDNSGNNGGNDDEERRRRDQAEEQRRREQAEKERKARAYIEKIENMNYRFVQDAMQSLVDLQTSLKGQMKVTVIGDKPFKMSLSDEQNADMLVNPSYVDIYDLQFLPLETQESLIKFESFYHVELEPEEKFLDVSVKLNEIKRKLAQLQDLREKITA